MEQKLTLYESCSEVFTRHCEPGGECVFLTMWMVWFNLCPSCPCSTGGRCTWWRSWPWSWPSFSLRSTLITSASSGSSCARSSSARWPDTASSPPSTGSASLEASPQSSSRLGNLLSVVIKITMFGVYISGDIWRWALIFSVKLLK